MKILDSTSTPKTLKVDARRNPADPTWGTPAERQEYFAKLGKGAPIALLRAAMGKPLFEPRMDVSSMGEYLRTVGPESVELVFHNLFHMTVRVGLTWFDFHWASATDSSIVRSAFPLDVDRPDHAVRRVENIVARSGRRGGKELAVGFCLPASKETIERLTRAFTERPVPVPFDAQAKNGDTCMSLITGTLASAAPELGIPRLNDDKALNHNLRHNPKVGVVTVYSFNDDVTHIRSPWVRLLGFAMGPPREAKLLELWDHEFRMKERKPQCHATGYSAVDAFEK